MACDFLNKSLHFLNISSDARTTIPRECYKGLDEYNSDNQLAEVDVFQGYPDALLSFSAACTIIFMIIGTPGNLFTIIALAKYRKVRNATAIFIINLSVSDLLFSITIFPITISLFLKRSWTTGIIMCRIFPAVNYGLTATSVFTIVAITINRYVMVAHPLYYPRMYQTRNLIIMIIAIWVGGFIMVLPILFEVWGRFSLDPLVGFCTVIPDKNDNSPKILIIIMGFVFPCFFIVACYSRIMYIVKKSTAKSNSRSQPTTSNIQSDSTSRNQEISTRELTSSGHSEEGENCDDKENNSGGRLKAFKKNIRATFKKRPRRMSTVPTRRDKRLQTMIIAILISFFTCHLPIMIAKTANKEFAVGPYGNMMGYILLYMTVCSNPIIYVVMSREYRQAYKSVFGFLCKTKISQAKTWVQVRITNAAAQENNTPV